MENYSWSLEPTMTFVSDRKIRVLQYSIFFSFRPVHRTTWVCCRDVSTYWRPTSVSLAFPCAIITTPEDLATWEVPNIARPFSCTWTHAHPHPQGSNAVYKAAQLQKRLVRSMSPCLQMHFQRPYSQHNAWNSHFVWLLIWSSRLVWHHD